METRLLLSHRWRPLGYLLAVPFFLLGVWSVSVEEVSFSFLHHRGKSDGLLNHGSTLFSLKGQDFTNEVIAIGLLLGLVLIAFSREKFEDERVAKLRLESLLWGVYINIALTFLSIVFLYDELFLQAMVYNLFTTLIFFAARFRVVMWLENRKAQKTLA